jgi:hypothetical protein
MDLLSGLRIKGTYFGRSRNALWKVRLGNNSNFGTERKNGSNYHSLQRAVQRHRMSALIGIIILQALTQQTHQGGKPMRAQSTEVQKKKSALKTLFQKLFSSPQLTREEWERLESKKIIKRNESDFYSKRIH